MKIDKIIQDDDENKIEEWMKYHPHSLSIRLNQRRNTLHVDRYELSFEKGFPGYGAFDYHTKRVLTQKGQNKRSIWSLPEDFKTWIFHIIKRKLGKWSF